MLLAPRRSGTSFLVSSLNSHPQIQCYDDVFRCVRLFRQIFYYEKPGTPFFQYRSASFMRQLDYVFRRKYLMGAFLTELYGSANGKKANIVRITYPQDYPETLEWALQNDVGIIHLIRENLLKSIVYALASKAKTPTIYVLPARLRSRLTARVSQIEKYRTMFRNKRYCEVSSEAFATNGQVESCRLLEFLDVDRSVPLTFGLRKGHAELEQILENYDEIFQAFKGTEFEKFLAV